ncbi:phosphoribosylanthranilate isomerase [Phytohalomonas tamaricis]|uniref:phosphoribosylanthranilate isomerase n=1 Tax=Phytohalomonas tamaricis TaxID=2081032 RepID=UPI000D0B3B03|nr:phosphoribosylanthranilate isomerase [Phytohalomonas tamaricis]
MRTRVKICGLTRAEDVDAAVRAGADALGFVLWPGSRRALDLDTLKVLSARVPAFVTRVGLFVDQDAETIASCTPFLDMLQFHGDEPPEECQSYGRPWMKAVRMRDNIDLHAEAERYRGAQGVLLDAFKPGVPGGTGETFDWSRIPAGLAKPVILAGGLTPDNVAEAIVTVKPFAVDVSGGVETTIGVKDHAKIETFIRNVFA